MTSNDDKKRPSAKAASARRKTRRLVGKIPSIRSLSRKDCPPGQILRKAYVRRYSTAVRAKGFTVKKSSGKTYRVHPTNKNMLIESQCVKDMGLPGKSPKSGKAFGPLKRGELSQYGYSFRTPESQRHAALKKAVQEYTPLGVFRKLDAVAKLMVRTAPTAAKVFAADSDWIRSKFGPLKE